LQEAAQRELIVFVLVLLSMGVRAELSTSSPALQERELLSAIKTPHMAQIVPFHLMLKGTLTAFYAVKHLSSGFEVPALWLLRAMTLGQPRLKPNGGSGDDGLGPIFLCRCRWDPVSRLGLQHSTG